MGVRHRIAVSSVSSRSQHFAMTYSRILTAYCKQVRKCTHITISLAPSLSFVQFCVQQPDLCRCAGGIKCCRPAKGFVSVRDFWLPPRCACICALLVCYAASSGSFVPTFRDNVSVPSSRVEFVPKRRYRTVTHRCIISRKSANLQFC